MFRLVFSHSGQKSKLLIQAAKKCSEKKITNVSLFSQIYFGSTEKFLDTDALVPKSKLFPEGQLSKNKRVPLIR